jgi:hypothetical protein
MSMKLTGVGAITGVTTISSNAGTSVDIDATSVGGLSTSQLLRSDVGGSINGSLTTINLTTTNAIQSDGGAYIAAGLGGQRYYFRDGRIDCVDNTNSNWGVWTNRASQYYLTDPSGNNALHYNNGAWQILGTGGSQSTAGTIVTSPGSTVGRALDVPSGSYLEFSASGRAVGCTYFVSDERYKENIGITSITKEQSANLINSIAHKQFDWNDQNPAGMSGTHVDIGYTAQDLESVHSTFSTTMSDGKKMVNTNNLMIHLTHTVQHLMDKVDDLQSQIDALTP